MGKNKGKKAASGKYGTCALTGIEGKFVKSHLLPQALTQPETPGQYFIEAGNGSRPVRRFTSWYDDRLVTREGEDILSDIDNKAITELRKQRLVWSGWGHDEKLICSDHDVLPMGKGLRIIEGLDSSVIRLFYLSLLWRALKTQRPELAYLPKNNVDLDMIREMIVSNDSGNSAFYPVALHQISTRGETHNFSPIYDTMVLGEGFSCRLYRFYFQGLVAHIYHELNEEKWERLSAMCVGALEKTLVFTHEFLGSAQSARLEHVRKEFSEQS